MKRIACIFLSFAMILSLCSCAMVAEKKKADDDTVSMIAFSDDCGRVIDIPAEITKVAVTGPLAQVYAYSICSDILAGFATDYSLNAEKYIPEEILQLPTLGQLYGGRGTMDLEALLASDPDIVIDIGEQKDTMKDDLDNLTNQSGIPFVHIDATVSTTAEAYTKLGALLNREEKAEELCTYLNHTLDNIDEIMRKVDKDGKRKTVVYCLGDKGLNVLAEKSNHAETINAVADNAAKIENANASGNGNEVDMEQLLIWNPDVIVFEPESVYSKIEGNQTWNKLDAVKNGQYYRTPFGPYGWLQSPPAVQRYLGLIWLTYILYPEYCNYDLQEEVTEYYRLFYNYDLSDEDYAELMADSLGR